MITLDQISSDLQSISIKDEAGNALLIDASGHLTTNINGTVTVDATALDIRALTNADVVTAEQGGTWSVDVDSLPADVDIRDLSALQDNVAIRDGANQLKVNADGSIDVVADIDDIADAIAITKVAVDNTVGGTQLVASPLANRREITIQNFGSQDIYINDGSADANDIKVPKNGSATFKWSPSVDVYAFGGAAGSDVRVLEAA